ncbi:MAG: class I SAM-dependent methyltransferase [Candidatus Sungbacteria bacterium]|nr:class I SAM-dependent methyltransferase [Candidatus Sungbacteria bacterium]
MWKSTRFIAKYLYSIFASFYLFTIGIFTKRERAYLAEFAAHFGFETRRKKPLTLLPQVSPDALIRQYPPIVLRGHEGISGNVSLLELMLINSFIQTQKPKTLFEIGTFDGRTAYNMAANTDDGIVYTLDLPAENMETEFAITGDKKFVPNSQRKLRFTGTNEEKKIKRLFGDSATFDFSPFHGKIDLLFIDGAHTYEYVISDTQKTESMMRENGIVLWHDYGAWEGVTRALNELQRTNPRYKNIKHIKGTSLAYINL